MFFVNVNVWMMFKKIGFESKTYFVFVFLIESVCLCVYIYSYKVIECNRYSCARFALRCTFFVLLHIEMLYEIA